MRHFSKVNEAPPSATSQTFPSPLDRGLCDFPAREAGESKCILTLFECICCRTVIGSTPASIGKVVQSVKQKRLKSMNRRNKRFSSSESMNRTVVPKRETKASACLGRQQSYRSLTLRGRPDHCLEPKAPGGRPLRGLVAADEITPTSAPPIT